MAYFMTVIDSKLPMDPSSTILGMSVRSLARWNDTPAELWPSFVEKAVSLLLKSHTYLWTSFYLIRWLLVCSTWSWWAGMTFRGRKSAAPWPRIFMSHLYWFVWTEIQALTCSEFRIPTLSWQFSQFDTDEMRSADSALTGWIPEHVEIKR
jgi:hypothetical protein